MRFLTITAAAITALTPALATSAERISVAFSDAPLVEVIAALEDLTGRRITLRPNPSPRDVVTGQMADVTVDEFLTRTMRAQGYRWEFHPLNLSGLGVEGDSAYVIRRVQPGSAAERAGLRLGDVVTSINGQTVSSARDAVIAMTATDGPATLAVRRGSSVVRLSMERE